MKKKAPKKFKNIILIYAGFIIVLSAQFGISIPAALEYHKSILIVTVVSGFFIGRSLISIINILNQLEREREYNTWNY